MKAMFELIFRHPVVTLMLANAASAVLALVSLLVMLAHFAVADFAVTGVFVATGSLVSMGLDLRLLDLVSLRFYEMPEDQRSRRLAVMRIGFSLIAIQATLVASITIVALFALSGYFLQNPVESWWIICLGIFAGSQLGISGLITCLRLNKDFKAAGRLRVAVQASYTIFLVLLLGYDGTLHGYFASIALASIVSLTMALIEVNRVVWKSLEGSYFAFPPHSEFAALISRYRFLISGAYFSLGWMLMRAADVLVLATMSTDAVTGTYRIAKQCADAAEGLLNAVPLYFEPTIISALTRGDFAAFRKHRRFIIAIGAAVTICATGGVLMVIGPVVEAVYPRYLGSVMPLAILSATMAARSGIKPWLWPMLVANDKIRLFSLLMIFGATIQLSIMVLLGWFEQLDAVSAAMTSWVSAAVLFSPYLAMKSLRPA